MHMHRHMHSCKLILHSHQHENTCKYKCVSVYEYAHEHVCAWTNACFACVCQYMHMGALECVVYKHIALHMHV
jgi:hypothetical protein